MLKDLSEIVQKEIKEVDRLYSELYSKLSISVTDKGVHPSWLLEWINQAHGKLAMLRFTSMMIVPVLEFLVENLDEDSKKKLEDNLIVSMTKLQKELSEKIKKSKVTIPQKSNLIVPR